MPKPLIVLMPHDPRWARAFAAARADIMEACGDHLLDVLHVGSTAIPGIAAKPVIDMMPLLRRHQDGFACVHPMEALGFELREDGGLSGRHYFIKGQPRTHHVHMYPSDHPEVGRHVRFRDYLRLHPSEARAYEALKRQLAARFESDTRAYSNLKSFMLYWPERDATICGTLNQSAAKGAFSRLRPVAAIVPAILRVLSQDSGSLASGT